MKKKEALRVLLIQARENPTKEHEYNLVVENSGLAKDQFIRFDALNQESFAIDVLSTYDAVMIGGSPHCVLSDYSYLPFLTDVVRYCKNKDIPFLGICYGFQIAVQALGGEVVEDLESAEAGTYRMYRTAASDNDPIAGSLPREFLATCGRKDRTLRLPEGMVNYISSDKCSVHFAAFPGTNFYGVQFHPELWKKESNMVRINHYKQDYAMSEEEFRERIKKFEDAPHSAYILLNFIEKIVLQRICTESYSTTS